MFKLVIHQDKEDSNYEEERAVTVISKHDCKEEWESHNRKYRGISLLVAWNTIGICDFLEYICKLVLFEVSWWGHNVLLVFISSHLLELCGAKLVNGLLNDLLFFKWSPQKGNVGRTTSFHHIQRVINCLLLGHKPSVNLKS